MSSIDRLRIARGAYQRWCDEVERRRVRARWAYDFGTRQGSHREVWGLALAIWWMEELGAFVGTLEASR